MLLEMKRISKSFGPVNALRDVSFTVRPAEIHGLLGENGAGKTTLMNVLAGTFAQDGGDLVINGAAVSGMNPRKSASMKIRFIHQELSLCNDLRVYENMFLGEEFSHPGGLVKKKDEIKRAQEVLDYMNTGINAASMVEDLDTAQKQMVEIARALLFDSELIIMDEPTTALNTREIENLFVIMRRLRSQGVSFIYISHKMPEIFEICDAYTVLRDGAFIQTGKINDINEQKATELLIGRSFTAARLKENNAAPLTGETVFRAEKLCGTTFRDVSFDLRRGEVIAVTGLQGSGADELAMSLFGASPIQSGGLSIYGRPLNLKSIRHFMRSGVAMIPRNRKERGIVPDLSIKKNNSLAYYTAKHRRFFISDGEEHRRFTANKEKLDIRAGNDRDPITSLSGGNQQKVILGKWLEIDADVYIMDNPTQGIDVGSKYAVYQLINRMAAAGKSIILFSAEYQEIDQAADRCFIMYKGKVNAVLPRQDFSEIRVMEYSTGAKGETQTAQPMEAQQ